uniref:Ion transport domain-containing protein n=1 Tax=Chromera velia CCMP2878 TaxID=1169474 RepID=A0A0G4I9U6_9ALVE|eukprot:Cvel_12375.t1-p1 / transcript=Cvel_12375.t1 / gene=Cvel_12375 / organism=Chromera_velia_CCMP2878 / gene_product=hypothetical protein / transcript_product=hypothetical protein / location=Cvel_scaffold808:4425-18512(+) / protein_length=1453 / sequence_SO=supercontig / SO=protein_coding / is_pseudo=false
MSHPSYYYGDSGARGPPSSGVNANPFASPRRVLEPGGEEREPLTGPASERQERERERHLQPERERERDVPLPGSTSASSRQVPRLPPVQQRGQQQQQQQPVHTPASNREGMSRQEQLWQKLYGEVKRGEMAGIPKELRRDKDIYKTCLVILNSVEPSDGMYMLRRLFHETLLTGEVWEGDGGSGDSSGTEGGEGAERGGDVTASTRMRGVASAKGNPSRKRRSSMRANSALSLHKSRQASFCANFGKKLVSYAVHTWKDPRLVQFFALGDTLALQWTASDFGCQVLPSLQSAFPVSKAEAGATAAKSRDMAQQVLQATAKSLAPKGSTLMGGTAKNIFQSTDSGFGGLNEEGDPAEICARKAMEFASEIVNVSLQSQQGGNRVTLKGIFEAALKNTKRDTLLVNLLVESILEESKQKEEQGRARGHAEEDADECYGGFLAQVGGYDVGSWTISSGLTREERVLQSLGLGIIERLGKVGGSGLGLAKRNEMGFGPLEWAVLQDSPRAVDYVADHWPRLHYVFMNDLTQDYPDYPHQWLAPLRPLKTVAFEPLAPILFETQPTQKEKEPQEERERLPRHLNPVTASSPAPSPMGSASQGRRRSRSVDGHPHAALTPPAPNAGTRDSDRGHESFSDRPAESGPVTTHQQATIIFKGRGAQPHPHKPLQHQERGRPEHRHPSQQHPPARRSQTVPLPPLASEGKVARFADPKGGPQSPKNRRRKPWSSLFPQLEDVTPAADFATKGQSRRQVKKRGNRKSSLVQEWELVLPDVGQDVEQEVELPRSLDSEREWQGGTERERERPTLALLILVFPDIANALFDRLAHFQRDAKVKREGWFRFGEKTNSFVHVSRLVRAALDWAWAIWGGRFLLLQAIADGIVAFCLSFECIATGRRLVSAVQAARVAEEAEAEEAAAEAAAEAARRRLQIQDTEGYWPTVRGGFSWEIQATPMDSFRVIFGFLLLFTVFGLLLYELMEVAHSKKLSHYLTEFWNTLALTEYILILFLIMTVVCRAGGAPPLTESNLTDQRLVFAILSICVFASWMKILETGEKTSSFGPFVKVVFALVRVILKFFGIFLVFFLASAFALYPLIGGAEGSETFFDVGKMAFASLLFGETEPFYLATEDTPVLLLVALIITLIGPLLFVNMILALFNISSDSDDMDPSGESQRRDAIERFRKALVLAGRRRMYSIVFGTQNELASSLLTSGRERRQILWEETLEFFLPQQAHFWGWIYFPASGRVNLLTFVSSQVTAMSQDSSHPGKASLSPSSPLNSPRRKGDKTGGGARGRADSEEETEGMISVRSSHKRPTSPSQVIHNHTHQHFHQYYGTAHAPDDSARSLSPSRGHHAASGLPQRPSTSPSGGRGPHPPDATASGWRQRPGQQSGPTPPVPVRTLPVAIQSPPLNQPSSVDTPNPQNPSNRLSRHPPSSGQPPVAVHAWQQGDGGGRQTETGDGG